MEGLMGRLVYGICEHTKVQTQGNIHYLWERVDDKMGDLKFFASLKRGF